MATESEQRAQQQWDLFRLNLIAGGAIFTFAVQSEGRFGHALLIIPIISLTFFLYWFHHGIVIRFMNPKWEPRPLDWPEILRRSTIALPMLMNFVGFPLIAISLYSGGDRKWLVYVDFGCEAMIVVLFLIWMYLQYSQRVVKWLLAADNGNTDAQPPTETAL